jgi:hypothetical protein
MLSGSSLDISAALPHKGSPKGGAGDHSSAEVSVHTDVTPSTDASITSVICAATGDPRAPVDNNPRQRWAREPRTAEAIARRSLEDCRQDIEDEHLEVEGVIGPGRRGTVFWGTWRGLEVAIKSFEFEVRSCVCGRRSLWRRVGCLRALQGRSAGPLCRAALQGRSGAADFTAPRV